MDRIAAHYGKKSESQRLLSGRGELEFVRTKRIIEQFLPYETGLSIADVGGGSGPYAFWLAGKGHRVSLFDLVPKHIDEAVSINRTARRPLARIEVADVRSIELGSGQHDVVLLLGPLYHLTSAKERRQVLRKAADWLSPDGVGYVAYISRFASMLDGFTQRLYVDPEFLDIVKQDLETGVHRPNRDNTRYFTDAYFHHPDEIEREAEEAHLQVVDLIAPWRELPGCGRISTRCGQTRENARSCSRWSTERTGTVRSWAQAATFFWFSRSRPSSDDRNCTKRKRPVVKMGNPKTWFYVLRNTSTSSGNCLRKGHRSRFTSQI